MIPPPLSPPPPVPPGSRYVALGSSFAAGPGIEPLVDAEAGRSGRNYAHLVAEQAGLVLTDVTRSGATTRDLLHPPARRFGRGRPVPAQLEAVSADTALVTLTVGGNDLNYLGSLGRACLLNKSLGRLPFLGPVADRLGPIGAGPDALHAMTESLGEVLTAVRQRAPAARILIVDYLSVAGGETPGRGVPLTATQWRQAQATARALSAGFAAAADRAGAEYVDCATPSLPYYAGSDDPWVNGWTGRDGAAPLHPNSAGMAAVAELILGRIRS